MQVPPLLAGLVDDAAVLPPSNMTLAQALDRHRSHRNAWYRDLVGPCLVPASRLSDVARTGDGRLAVPGGDVARTAGDRAGGSGRDVGDGSGSDAARTGSDAARTGGEAGRTGGEAGRIAVGLVADVGPAPRGIGPLIEAAAAIPDHVVLRHLEVPVAMRNEDPLPGLEAVLRLDVARELPLDDGCMVYAEIPLTWGLLASLDRLAQAREAGSRVAAKFRTGGLAAELFPTPVELAAVICACRDRQLPFKLAAGGHRAIRRTDPETGLVTHGFLNVLGAVLAATSGAEPVDLAEILGGTDPLPVVEAVRDGLTGARPLWTGFGSGNITDVLADLRALGLLPPVSTAT